MQIKNNKLIAGAAALGTIFLSQSVFAADPIEIEEDPVPVEERIDTGWRLAIDPLYTWLPGMKGSFAGPNGNSVSFDVTTKDILDNFDEFLHALDGLYMGSGEILYNQYAFMWDVVYLDLSASAEFGNVIDGALDAGFKVSMSTLAGGYRFYESAAGHADVFAGITIHDVDITADVTLGPLSANASAGDTWVDPIIGAKGLHYLSPNWFVKGRAVYGGFGVGSNHHYDVGGFVGYQTAKGTQIYGGWRVADTDYSSDDFDWDVQFSGPMLGFTFRF
ncbi:MAG: hypothetical protein AAF362_12010 [Pseudomonadota bacterium]